MNKLKKSLICSAFSMLLCSSMFVGTTYAWFTDEANVPTNQIVAGNLDVELYAKVGDAYTPVSEETTLFDKNALWEPGHVEVANLKISNVGSLALQYSFSVNVADQTIGTSVKDDAPIKLSDHIRYAIIETDDINEVKTYTKDKAGRDEALLDASRHTPRKLSEFAYEKGYVLLPKDAAHPENISDHYVTMIVFMPTEVGNEANHKTGTPAPTIELGVNLSAKQSSFENDGFDNKYDDGADVYGAQINNKLYSNVSVALKNAKNGETVKMLKDATVTSIAYKPTVPTAVTLDLNGYTLSTTKTSYIGDYKTGEKLDFTIKNGTFNAAGTGIWPDAGTKLTLDNVNLEAAGNYGITLPSLKNNPKGDVELVVKNNSKITGKGYAGIVNFGPYPVTIENSTIEGKWFGLSQNGQAAAAASGYTISDSTFIATDDGGVGIYISNSYKTDNTLNFHTFNLTNSTAIGSTALEMKFTNATITGCTLISTKAEVSATENGNGPCTAGYSLAVTTVHATERVTGAVTVDETTEFKLKTGEDAEGNPVYEEGQVFVYNPDGGDTSVTVKGAVVSDQMTYYTPATPAA